MDEVTETGSRTVAWLEVTAGPASGQRIAVEGELRFGSEESGVARLEGDRWLSPSHAVLRHGEHGWTIEDLRSLEGTKVNGQPIRGAVVLREGDTIELGASRLVMVPEGKSTKPPGVDLRASDLRPIWRKRRRAWFIDRLVLVPVALAFGYVAHGRAAVLLAYTAVSLSYHFLCEALTGQTLGKSLMGIRVVDIRGRPVTPAAVATRAVLLMIDSMLIGLISIAVTGKRQQRLGDLAARTVVVPADVAFVPARRHRDRLTLWAYPFAWIVPCVLLFLLVPWASAPACDDAALTREGTCHVGSRLLDIKEAGHALQMDGFDADLLATRSRQLADGGELVSFQLQLTGTGADTFDPRSQLAVTLGVVDNTGVQRTFGPSDSSKLTAVARGKPERVWVRYIVPPDAVLGLGYAPSHLGVASVTEPDHIGWISLWLWAGAPGEKALGGLHSSATTTAGST